MAENWNKVLLGARGWQHAGWAGTFYPEDLPQDWQLNYYTNEFSVLVIPEQEWVSREDVSSLTEECGVDFRFVPELPQCENEAEWEAQMARLQQLGEYAGGVIIHHGQDQYIGSVGTIPIFSEVDGTLIKIPAACSLKVLRSLMETAMQSPTAMLLQVEGEPPDTELLHNAQILLELL
ncbi:hypothetical protein MNBD_GAMMA25-1326 [hydrothermal vent metagenome]|uniref:DUF72 domain-containing protein n=1 Tax=hydrothermal vent metagenome TaxID=652676 RepID=A0A3B1BH95_9ZZZZ